MPQGDKKEEKKKVMMMMMMMMYKSKICGYFLNQVVSTITKFCLALSCQFVATMIFLVSHILAHKRKIQPAMFFSLDKPISLCHSTALQEYIPEINTLNVAILRLKKRF